MKFDYADEGRKADAIWGATIRHYCKRTQDVLAAAPASSTVQGERDL
ncbi:hypothetical protein [Paraburkholderia hayleyella]|nr:hypothetical protein [Paraburkholderia hayleyella]